MPRPSTVPEELEQRIVSLIRQGFSPSFLSKKLNIEDYKIKYIVKKRGLKGSKRLPKKVQEELWKIISEETK
jgi:hypothetical protein